MIFKFSLFLLVYTNGFLGLKAQLVEDILDSNLIVRVTSNKGQNEGSGFVIGSINDTLYVVTALHVIEKESNISSEITIKIDDCAYVVNSVHKHDSSASKQENISSAYDIALLKVYIPLIKIKVPDAIIDPSECKDMYFIRSNEEKNVLPIKKNGSFEYWESSDDYIFCAYVKDVKPGDSGSALFNKGNIAGMIIQHKGRSIIAISILHIYKVLSKFLPNNFSIHFIENTL